MKIMILDNIKNRIGNFGGDIGISYIDLKSGQSSSTGNCDVFLASGSVKIMTLVEAFKRIEEGTLNKDDKYTLKETDYLNKGRVGVKTFGALEHIHQGIELTIEDLYKFSITVSDNIAFNILLKMFGTEEINKTIKMLGYSKTKVHRAIYDSDKMNKGIENLVSVQEMASLFYRMYKGQVISRNASKNMLDILKDHQKDSIIPYYFDESLQVAHQTGYDDELIMDMGIVYSENPFVLCMAASDSNTRNAESIMRDITLMCYRNSNR
ncbi:MAG: serine hydrolase [Anaerovoracaceae bacterium]